MPVRVFWGVALLAAVSHQGCCTPDDTTLNIPEQTITPTNTPSEMPTPQQDCTNIDEHLNGFIHSVEPHSDGSILVVVGGQIPGGAGKIIRADWQKCVTSVLSGIEWPHSAHERSINGETYTLVTETGSGNVLVYDQDYQLLHTIHQLSDSSTLLYPNNADWLTDSTILVTDRYQNKVLELNLDGGILWQYGGDGKLAGPHSGRRLANGNTLISDSDNDRVVEVSKAGSVVWSYYGTLDWPRGVSRLDNGNTLIVSSYEGVVVEVSKQGQVVRRSYTYNLPYEVVVGPNGSLLLSVLDDVVTAGFEISDDDSYLLDKVLPL